jgi:hypothetical protein
VGAALRADAEFVPVEPVGVAEDGAALDEGDDPDDEPVVDGAWDSEFS